MPTSIIQPSTGSARNGFRGGAFWITWATYNSGTSGPMTAHGKYRGESDTSISAAFVFLDPSGNPLVIADFGMANVVQSADGQDKYIFTPVIDGETAMSTWWSTDQLRTWTRFT